MYHVGGWLDWFVGAARAITGERLGRVVSGHIVFLWPDEPLHRHFVEMIVSVLPIYLVGFLRMSPAQFGVIDGLYQGAAGVVQLMSAVVADRRGRYNVVE